jgi:opacity protein-like surface antigen
MMKRAVPFLLLLGLLATANCYAQEAAPAEPVAREETAPSPKVELFERGRHSLSLDGGLFLPAKNNIAGVGSIHTGYYADVKYVFKPNDMFSFASTAGLYGTNADSSTGQRDVYSLVTIPLKETVLLTIPIDRLELYGGAGVGYYLAFASVNGATATYDSNDSNFGYHFTSGAELRVTPRISIQAEAMWEYSWVHLTDANGGSSKVNIGGTVVDAGIKIKF